MPLIRLLRVINIFDQYTVNMLKRVVVIKNTSILLIRSEF